MSLTYVLSTLRRRWLIILLGLLLGALAGASFAATVPDRYESTASLVVAPVISNPQTGSREEVNIRTEQEILGSQEVARRAAAALGLDGGESLRRDVEVAAPQGSHILRVTVRGDTPRQAAEGANALATAYLELRGEVAANATERYLQGVDERIEELRAEPSAPVTDGLIERLQEERSSVTPSDQDPGRIIGSAVPPAEPSGPGLPITAAGGAMAGMLLGIAAAVLRERLDPRVRSADRLELAVGALPLVVSRRSDDAFWVRLADEAVHRAESAVRGEQVRMLVHTLAPMPSRTVAHRLLVAARGILSDSGTGLSWSPDCTEAAQVPQIPSAGCVLLVPSGRYRTSIVHAAQRSDVAVVVATPRASLKDLTELVTTLRECDVEVVVGISDPLVAPDDAPQEPATEGLAARRHRTDSTERRELDTVPVPG